MHARIKSILEIQSATGTWEVSLPPLRIVGSVSELTPQQQEAYFVHKTLKKQLGRPPSVEELRSELSGNGNKRIGAERCRKIVSEINQLLGKNIELTPNRPFFTCYNQVKSAFELELTQRSEPPQFRTFLDTLRKQGIPVTETSLRSIVADLRQNAKGKEKSQWRFSRKRNQTGWPEIGEAHAKAVEYLAKRGSKALPSAEEVSHFLAKSGITFSPRALEFRFRNKPENISLSIGPYVDSALSAIHISHRRLKKKLHRPPTIDELTEAVNQISIRQSTPEAIWGRVTRDNRERKTKPLQLAATRPSGVYDSDIKRSHSQLVTRLSRPPTFQELFASVLAAHPKSRIREDSFQRRVSKLELPLTHENVVKRNEQREVGDAIKTLAARLKRRPLRGEVLDHLSERGAAMDESSVTRVLGTLKRRLDGEDKQQYHLGFPHRYSAALIDTHRRLTRDGQSPPSIAETAKAIGWSQEGVTRTLPYAYEHASEHGRPLFYFANTPLAESISTIGSCIEALQKGAPEARIKKVYQQFDIDFRKAAADWLGLAGRPHDPLNEDLKLLPMRIQMLTIAAAHFHTARKPLSEDLSQLAHAKEIGWAGMRSLPTLENNIFAGIAHSLLALQELGRMKRSEVGRVLEKISSFEGMGDPLVYVPQILNPVVTQLGAPDIAVLTRLKRQAGND